MWVPTVIHFVPLTSRDATRQIRQRVLIIHATTRSAAGQANAMAKPSTRARWPLAQATSHF